ncbi:hypothetical protein J4P02_20855 [Pseudomonas sp. NFXW11]|uniref:hypothetical protein n=1 Tax=Pseudomonas sp. NFXW11 TaxID=2819531 RepID=UPI003CF82821
MDIKVADVAFALCKPIFAERNKKQVQVGSCSFLEMGGESFLITARHVLETKGDKALYVGTRKGGLSLHRGYYKSALTDVKGDKFDIAIYPLGAADLEQLAGDALFIDREMIVETTLPTMPALVLGYPSSKNKGPFARDEPVRVEVHGIHTEVVETSPEYRQAHGATAEANFFLNYSRPKGEPQLFSPVGMSGGLVVGAQPSQKPKVLGMPIEKSKDGKRILCTHYRFIYNSVERILLRATRPDKQPVIQPEG